MDGIEKSVEDLMKLVGKVLVPAKPEDEFFACNDDPLTITHVDQSGKLEIKTVVHRGEFHPRLYVKERNIQWKCGNHTQYWAAPEGTKYIAVFRRPNGAGTVIYYK